MSRTDGPPFELATEDRLADIASEIRIFKDKFFVIGTMHDRTPEVPITTRLRSIKSGTNSILRDLYILEPHPATCYTQLEMIRNCYKFYLEIKD